MTVQLDPDILDILACPQCHANVSIDYDAGEVVCVGLTCGLAYPIKDDIPVMLVEAARSTRTENLASAYPVADSVTEALAASPLAD
ncbi:MAG: Trm112 family protein [Propionibacteriaceae bacterium]|jgi:uncharacterized protein YbaR (Trm112 family)|nr:Trm112 family protein [Propionibacteriaceae bacterium]